MNRTTENWCPICNKAKSLTSFYSFEKRHLIVCKACSSERFRTLHKYTHSDSAAIWLLCAQQDIPFIYGACENAINLREQKKGKDSRVELFSFYMQTIPVYANGAEYFYQSDTMLNNLIDTGKQGVVLSEDADSNLAEQELIWGKYKPEDYQLLNRWFDEYTANIYNMDANLQNRYRDLCRAQFTLRVANETGDPSVIAKAQSNLNDLLKLLKLNDFQQKQSDQEKFIDRWAWRIENTKPAECKDLEKYKDFAKNESMWLDIARTLTNAVAGSREYPNLEKIK